MTDKYPHYPPPIPGNGPKAMLSLCIVSNRLDALLEKIVHTCAAYADEVLIGYDGVLPGAVTTFTDPGNVKIIPVKWEGFSTTKNKLAAMARNAWILSLDSDELPDGAMLQAISGLPFATLIPATVYSLKRISFFEGKEIRHGAWGRDRVLRLYNKQYTAWNKAVVHEDLSVIGDTQLVPLPGILYHYTADRYDTFLEKNRRYARLSADKYFAAGKKSPFWKRLLSPVFTFIKEYLFQGGFLDGPAGWKIARINAAYTRWKYQYLWEQYQDSAS